MSFARIPKKCVLRKNDPLREHFENFVLEGFTVSQIHVLCANFMKFGRPEIGKVVRYLPDKKKIGSRSRCRFCADCAQNLSRPAPDNILGVSQISSKLFTSGGVIAERVNVVQTRHKVFPILGQAPTSSPSKNEDENLLHYFCRHIPLSACTV